MGVAEGHAIQPSEVQSQYLRLLARRLRAILEIEEQRAESALGSKARAVGQTDEKRLPILSAVISF